MTESELRSKRETAENLFDSFAASRRADAEPRDEVFTQKRQKLIGKNLSHHSFRFIASVLDLHLYCCLLPRPISLFSRREDCFQKKKTSRMLARGKQRRNILTQLENTSPQRVDSCNILDSSCLYDNFTNFANKLAEKCHDAWCK